MTYPDPPVDRSLKVPHLVFGLLFLGIAGLWALGESGSVSGESLAVLGPAVLILAGVIALVASLASARNRRQREQTPPITSFDTTSSDTTATDTTYDLEQ